MNTLLLRQIRKHIPANLVDEKQLKDFFEAVNQSYNNYEDQLKISQRAMLISSDELFNANTKLREDAESQKEIINNLKIIVKTFNLDNKNLQEDDKEIINLAQFIKKQSKEILKINKQREELLANLEYKNEELNNYAHIVSHDLKSPLRSIDSLINWILADTENTINEESKLLFDLILKNLEKMDAMINGILNYSTIDKDKTESYDVDLNLLINDLIESLIVPSHITIEIKEPLPIVKADKYRLHQLFQNLIQNAINNIDKKNGKITIGFSDSKTNNQLYVQDNGKGIPKKFHKKIFEIFQSLDQDKNSTGIGLSIVKRIIDFYHGTIWLESEIDVGTTFYFTIPKKN
jgi:signal transduction histidine kinase